MDNEIHSDDEKIRKIEDIIDIQKANGNYNPRQVAFSLPSESERTISANLLKNLESCGTDTLHKLRSKKTQSKRQHSPLSDVISWPSDSDITVLRMKLCLTNADLKEKLGNTVLGDGLHVPDSSSMFNLATLMLQSQPPSKHNLDEYLLPLTSWEPGQQKDKELDVPEESFDFANQYNRDVEVYEAVSTRKESVGDPLHFDVKHYDVLRNDTKTKLAKFLRLYFCPCCTCLYKMEAMSEEPSVYCTTETQKMSCK